MRNGHSTLGLVLRVLAAALVVVAAIALRDLVDEGGGSGTAGSRVVTYTIDSKVLDRKMPVEVVIPPGARDGRRSLLVFLHGRGENERSYLTKAMFRALRKQGGKAPVVAFPRGDPDSYWHDRSSGNWGSYVLDEVIPQIARRFEIEPERIAIGGISMGGFGALDIAARDPGRFCAVGAHSPAIWSSASDTADGRLRQRVRLQRPRRDLRGRSPGQPARRQAGLARRRRRGPFPRRRQPARERAAGGRRPGSLLRGQTAATRPRTGTRTGSATCSSTRAR